jgi:ATP-dependent Clp protease ATP-binding subunit ClpC
MDILNDSEFLSEDSRTLAQNLMESVQAMSTGEGSPGANHWLVALLRIAPDEVSALRPDLDTQALGDFTEHLIHEGRTGSSVSINRIVTRAVHLARYIGHDTASRRDIATFILAEAGFPPSAEIVQGNQARGRDDGKKPTAMLETFGRDLCSAARQHKLGTFVGRSEELDLVIEVLCRHTKPNPVLVGPAGVGKTAIVEGLAQRIVRGDVPEPLCNTRVFALQASALAAGVSVYGEMESRVKQMISEASQDGVVLFFDEMHALVGSGGKPGVSDIASLLKPSLAGGEIRCIAATTDDEYRKYIEQDEALERRFVPVRVQELSSLQTLDVLRVARDDLATLRNVTTSDAILEWLVDFASRALRNRHFPDKGVDMLEQVVAFAVAHDKPSVEMADVRAVAERMIGVPLSVAERLGGVRQRLAERGLLAEADIAALQQKLEGRVRGLDLHPERPNAVILLLGKAAANSESIAEELASSLLGSAERVVTIDLARMAAEFDISALVGSPAGYVGYGDTLPLHRIAQMPWCVVRLEHVDNCHPRIREYLTRMLASGVFTDAMGKRVYLSDTIVILTAAADPSLRHGIGFRPTEQGAPDVLRQTMIDLLGADLLDQVDLVAARVLESGQAGKQWLEGDVLQTLSNRYRHQGVKINWDESLVKWLLKQQQAHTQRREWERVVESQIGRVLIPHLHPETPERANTITVRYENDQIEVDAEPGESASEPGPPTTGG